jgi:hypothetical protein
MSTNTTAVTQERFEKGMTYKDYIAQINVNKDRFAQYYETVSDAIIEQDADFFKQAVEKGATRALVLGEDWCPDVYRGMPVIARIGDVSGMDIRIFPRDNNLDIMNEFLKDGEHQSIPVIVFYTSDQEYICHWIERPAIANKEMGEISAQLEKEMPDQDEQTIRQARRERVTAHFPSWQKETVSEIRAMLGQKLGL